MSGNGGHRKARVPEQQSTLSDATALILVGMICLTIVAIVWIIWG